MHDGGETKRGLEIVCKHEECCTERMESAVELNTIADRRHRKLANTKVNVCRRTILRAEEAFALEFSLVGGRKIRASAKQIGQIIGKDVEHVAADRTGGLCAAGIPETCIRFERGRQLLLVPGNPLGKEFRISFLVGFKHRVIVRVLLAIANLKLRHISADIRGNGEGFLLPIVEFTHSLDGVVTQRFAVCACGICLRRSVGNLSADDDQRRMFGVRLGVFNRLGNRFGVLAVCYILHRPAIGLEALADILGEREAGVAFNGDLVTIVEQNQLAKSKMARQRSRLRCNTFHEAAITAQHIGIVVHNRITITVKLGSEPRLRHSHTDSGRNALPERAGGRLHADGVRIFRMTRRFAAPLTEALEFLHRQPVAKQMQQGIFQHRGMSGGEHEAIAPYPGCIFGIMFHLFPEGKRHGRRSDGQTRMSAVRLLHGFRREESYVGNRSLFDRFHKQGSFPVLVSLIGDYYTTDCVKIVQYLKFRTYSHESAPTA